MARIHNLTRSELRKTSSGSKIQTAPWLLNTQIQTFLGRQLAAYLIFIPACFGLISNLPKEKQVPGVYGAVVLFVGWRIVVEANPTHSS